MAELSERKDKMSKCVCVWKPVLEHFHTCLLEMMKTTVGGVEKSLEKFMYFFGLEEKLSKAASCIRFEIIA